MKIAYTFEIDDDMIEKWKKEHPQDAGKTKREIAKDIVDLIVDVGTDHAWLGLEFWDK